MPPRTSAGRAAVEIAVELAVSPGVRLPIRRAQFLRDVKRALSLAGFRGSLSLAVVTDLEMRRVNRDFHATDAPTDVLAFPLGDVPVAGAAAGSAFAAEVVVSIDTARREARARGVAPAAELLLYVVHGVLHLLGHDDHDAAKARVMHRETLAILGKLGWANTISLPPEKVRVARRPRPKPTARRR